MNTVPSVRKIILMYPIFAIILLLLSGCQNLARYDDATNSNLTALKSEMKQFFGQCENGGAAGTDALTSLQAIKTKSTSNYEYEKHKEYNDDTIAQFAIIDTTISQVLIDYGENKLNNNECKKRTDNENSTDTGCISAGYCTGKWKALEAKLDIAIDTEKQKNK